MQILLISWTLVLLGATGCTSTHVSVGAEDAGTQDGPAPDVSEETCPPGRDPCRPGCHSCPEGTTCRPAPGDGAECVPDNPCAAMDVESLPVACGSPLGYAWDGTQCWSLTTCSCSGSGCDRLYPSEQACRDDHVDCPRLCGDSVCGADEICCGGCGGPGACTRDLFCPSVLCLDLCAPQDARGDGNCRLWAAVKWTGTACVHIAGCACVGGDCDAVYSDMATCEAAHRDCDSGCVNNTECSSEYFCNDPNCGTTDVPGSCHPRLTFCPHVIRRVCGCDSATYANECEAHYAGMSVAHEGACDCRSAACPPNARCAPCPPMADCATAFVCLLE